MAELIDAVLILLYFFGLVGFAGQASETKRYIYNPVVDCIIWPLMLAARLGQWAAKIEVPKP